MSVSWMELLSLVTGHETFSKGKESYLLPETARFSLFLLLIQGICCSTWNPRLRKIKVHSESFWKDTTQPVKKSQLKYHIKEIFLS